MREKISKSRKKTDVSLTRLKDVKIKLEELKYFSKNNNVFPISVSTAALNSLVNETEVLVQSNVSRAQGTEFLKIAKGKENPIISQLQNTLFEQLQKKKEGVSAYLVSKDYSEAKKLGTIADLTRFANESL